MIKLKFGVITSDPLKLIKTLKKNESENMRLLFTKLFDVNEKY